MATTPSFLSTSSNVSGIFTEDLGYCSILPAPRMHSNLGAKSISTTKRYTFRHVHTPPSIRCFRNRFVPALPYRPPGSRRRNEFRAGGTNVGKNGGPNDRQALEI